MLSHGGGTNTIVRKCAIRYRGGAAVRVGNNCEATIVDCTFTGKKGVDLGRRQEDLAAVEIAKGAKNCLVTGGSITGGAGHGLLVSSTCDVKRVAITDNALCGIEVRKAGFGRIDSCRILNNGEIGVRIARDGKGNMRDSTVTGNLKSLEIAEPDRWQELGNANTMD